MAQLVRLSVILLCCLFGVICVETDDSRFKEAAQFVLDSFNSQPDSVYVYDSAKIINVYEKNDSLPSQYFMQLDIAVSCNSSLDCTPSHIICELVLRENSSTNTKVIAEDRKKCATKEVEPILPTNGHGFGEELVTNETSGIAAFAVQQLENNGDAKRSVVNIMSAKRQVTGNGTTLYLTLKVAKTEGGDALLFEVCEAEVNQTAEMVFESNLTCFPLSGVSSDASLSAADVTAIAERAADELDSLSYSEFTLKLVDILRAETTVTAGSDGTVTTLELRLAPTLCLKNVDIEGDTDGLYDKRQCPENMSNGRIRCSITSWDRPWVDDTLYSEPSCYQDARDGGTGEMRHASENVRERQGGNADTMMNDGMEPLNEEPSLLAVEHHSVPVVEELDPIVEKIEEPQAPVVEDTIIATHTYCTGCPTDLDVGNPALQEYVDQALAVIDEGSYGRYMHKAMRIAKAQKQVVNGVKYILQLEVAETSCLKGSVQDRTSCMPDMNSVRTCLVEFLEKPWLDSSREIVSNNCTYYNNDLENEIRPHILPDNEANRQDIFDYLDAMIEPELVTAKVPSSYGRDGLYLPENEPENHPLETDAEQIDVSNSDGIQKKSDKAQLYDRSSESSSEEEKAPNPKTVSDDSGEAEEPESHRVQDDSDESDESFVERQEKVKEKFAAYVTGENRDRRQTTPWSAAAGGLKDIDDSEVELVNKLAHIAVRTLDDIDEDDRKRVVLEVLGAQKQIVNGVLYHLQLRVATTSCSENGANKPDCIKHHSSPVKICKVELHRSFTDSTHLDAKVVKSECAPEDSILHEKTLRQKRNDGSLVVGGASPASTNDPYITRLADFAVSELDKGTNSLYTQCIVNIVSASKQVVAGYNVFLVLELGESSIRKGEANNGSCELNQNSEIKTCHVTIWDRPWLENSQQVTSFNCSAKLSTDRVKRQVPPLPGAPAEADVSDPYIQEIAGTALAEVDRRSNALYRQKVVRIVNAQKQVVAGTLVRLTLELGYTACRKGEAGDVSNCQLKEDSNNQICYVEVWDRPWLSLREITNISCSVAGENTATAADSRVKRELSSDGVESHSDVLVGAPVQAEVSDPYIQEIARSALEEVDRRSNALYRQKVVRIVNAQKQVVAGTLVRLTLELGYSTCRKGHSEDLDACQLRNNSNNQVCHVEVWDRPWLKLREVTNVLCSSAAAVNRVKRKSWIGGGSHDIHIGLFNEFINKYNKNYKSQAEYKRRFHIYRANMKRIEHLQKTEQGTAVYGATQFADLTSKEFKKYHLGLNPKLKVPNSIPLQEAKIPDVALPEEFDWRDHNVVTEVKNQGVCGSCWAFSVTGNVEGQWAIQKGKLYSLSEQELVDCDTLDDGCNGGLPENAYKAIESLGGLETEKDYPYEGDDEKCHFKKSDVKVTVQGAVNITKNETQMAQWLYKNGPISIGINANAMQFYMGGVSHPWKFLCNGDDLDHGVLIVGFGVHKTSIRHRILPYWLVKNSWGTFWGEKGYYRVYRGDGTCGVNQMATSAIVG